MDVVATRKANFHNRGGLARGKYTMASSEKSAINLPMGISGIVIVGLFAAVISTADASLQIAIESVKEDIPQGG